jgi:hypothetical protein
MNAFLIGVLIFLSVSGAGFLAMRVNHLLPNHHRNAETKDVVKIAMGMVATMTALILGLLVSSAKHVEWVRQLDNWRKEHPSTVIQDSEGLLPQFVVRKIYEVTKGVTLHWLTPDQTPDVMLDRGELDAIFPPNVLMGITSGDPTVIDRYGGTPMTGNPKIRRLVNDQGKAVISEFFRKTGCYHANHHLIIKNSLLREHPWVPMELYKAFQQEFPVFGNPFDQSLMMSFCGSHALPPRGLRTYSLIIYILYVSCGVRKRRWPFAPRS